MGNAHEPGRFAWGYRYAFSLSVIVVSLYLGTLSSTFPLALIFFCLRYYVDKHSLDERVWVMGPENAGVFTVQVVTYMKLIVSVWWMLIGVVVMAYAQRVSQTWRRALYIFAGFLMIFWGMLVFLLGQYRRVVESWIIATQTDEKITRRMRPKWTGLRGMLVNFVVPLTPIKRRSLTPDSKAKRKLDVNWSIEKQPQFATLKDNLVEAALDYYRKEGRSKEEQATVHS